MKRPYLLIAAWGTALACAGEDPISPPPPAPAPPTYVIFGMVQDEAGAALGGALAYLVGLGRSATSNDGGFFTFAGVSGLLTVRVRKDGYEPQSRSLFVAADMALNVKLTKLAVDTLVLLSDTLVLNRTIRSTVDAAAPPCDPIRWDASAPCRRFNFTPPYSGVLVLSISWSGTPEIDASIVEPVNNYVAISQTSGAGTITVMGGVAGGHAYEIRVNSYYGQQTFILKAVLY